MGFSLKDALTSAFNVGKDLFLGEGKKYGQFGDVESGRHPRDPKTVGF